ncbi:hypothetical protein LJB87_00600 [Alistipes sp. OttesenSCG-928-L06]|nr:hypothetical protein [Alistipes sp. OttesenSCG-928-L06]
MKKGILFLLTIAAVVLSACTSETSLPTPQQNAAFTLLVEVDEINAGTQLSTRGTYPAAEGESTINTLHLLFFEHQANGGGQFVKAYKVNSPLMNGSYPITFGSGEGVGLSETQDYSILAIANMAGYLNDSSAEALDIFLDRFNGMTEKQAVDQTALQVTGVGTDQNDDSKKIPSSNIFMSARTTRLAGDATATIKLTRGVSRIDVALASSVAAGYDLVSASIWGAASATPVWYDKMTETPERLRRFYGLKRTSGFKDEIKGGLYAFENFVSSPQQNDDVTTCLILGLKPDGTALSQTTYYRVNVHPDKMSQDLVRNDVYRVRVDLVTSEGADSEYGAWNQSETLLSVSVNEWNLDEEGMVQTDGVNTLAIPVKRVRLNPAGDSREYSIFTMGPGTLTISREQLPDGITVELHGTLLKVYANALPSNQSERRGSIELSMGSLRGTITFIQSPMEDKFLTLNRYEIPSYAPVGRTGISDNIPFTVNASGAWTAIIYNMSTDPTNPGFSFNPSGTPLGELKSQKNPFGDMFQVYTTGDNDPMGGVRNGFVVVSLDGDPEYNRVVVLSQRGKSDITLLPAFENINFTSDGTPIGVAKPLPGGYFEFTVNPGYDSGGQVLGWKAEVQSINGDHEYFEVTTLGSGNRILLQAKGTHAGYDYLNLANRPLSAWLQITLLDSPDTYIRVPIAQEKETITLSTQGTQVPNSGGYLADITVNLHPSLQWDARVVSNSIAGHPGYLVQNQASVGSSLSAQPQATKFSVGFDKMFYPFVNQSPQVVIEVSATVNPDIKTTLTVTQGALLPQTLNILDVRNTSYGCLIGGTHYLAYYRDYLRNTTMFGPKGTVMISGNMKITGLGSGSRYDPGTISSDYSYLHVGGQPGSDYSQARHLSVENWRKANDKVVVYACDNRNGSLFAGSGNSYTTGLSTRGYTYKSTGSHGYTARINSNAVNTNIMKYLLKDGPFTNGVELTRLKNGTLRFYHDSTSSGVNPGSAPFSDGAVAVIVDPNGTPMLVIDPKGRLVYIGESQFFNDSSSAHPYNTPPVKASSSEKSKFLGNLLAYIINAAQYGSSFTDHFLPGSTTYDETFVKP